MTIANTAPAELADLLAMTPTTGPTMARHRSEQVVGTDPLFVAAVEAHFGRIDFDLAATAGNRLAVRYFSKEQDALAQDWTQLRGNLWLNPEFSDIAPWARKCAETASDRRPRHGQRIFLLTPASVGTNWFAEHVHGKAFVLALQGRITFVGHEDPYPKDCILSVYGGFVGFDVWDWKRDVR